MSLVINEDEGNKLSIGLKINNDYGPDFEEIDTINMMLIINNPNFDKDFPEAAMTKCKQFVCNAKWTYLIQNYI